MKTLILPLFLIFTTSAFAQNTEVLEETASIDGKSRNCLTVVIASANTSDISKAWKKELKDMKGKVSDKKFLFADDCKVKSMGDNSFDVYAMAEPANGGAKLLVAFDLGGAYLGSRDHPDRFNAAKAILYNFAIEQTKEVVKIEIKGAEKTLATMGKDLVLLQKSKEESEAEIEAYKLKITEAQEAIKTNVAQQATKKTEIEGQTAIVGTLGIKLEAVK